MQWTKWLAAGLLIGLMSAPVALGQPTTRPARQRATTGPGGPGGAGGPRGDGSMMLERAQKLVDELKLSDDQKKKVGDIFDKARDELKTMRQELENAAPRERMERVRDFFGSVRQDVSSVLSDEQKQEFQKKMEGLRDRMRGEGPGGAGGPGGQGFGERVRENLQKLDLSDEQKAKVKTLFEDVQAKMQQIREEHQGEMDKARDKMREVITDTREKLDGILTESQRDKLKELMGQEGGPTSRPAGKPGGAGGRGAGAAEGKPGPKAAGGEMSDTMMGDNMGGKGASRERSAVKKPASTAPAIAVGASVPDLQLRKLDGGPLQLSSFKGRPVVLEFGSYSSPSFRQRAAQMEQLKKEFGGRVTFLVVYTAEAHPVGVWEADRNKDEKIFMEPHKTIEDRKVAATKAKDALKISIPIVLDDMQDSVAKTFGAQQNGLVILRDGKVVARQEWADPYGAKRHIENALVKSDSATTRPVG